MEDIRLKIKGVQIGMDFEEEIMEFITDGKLYNRNGKWYLLYEESEVSGIEGYKTSLRYGDDNVRLKRIGKNQEKYTILEFEKGKKYNALYSTPFGSFEIEILTNKLEKNISSDGRGTIDVDYSICLKGLSEGRNKINIEIM